MPANTILLVEDDGILCSDMEDMLRAEGYVVMDVLPSGEAALELVKKRQPDLIIMDVKLAGKLDGISTAQQLKKIAHIPVIYITAYTEDMMIRRARETSPYAYLVKPVQERELIAAIEMALQRHRLEQKLRQTEEALRQSEEFYRSVVTAINEGIIIQDSSLNIVTLNRAAINILDISSDEALDLLTAGKSGTTFWEENSDLPCQEDPSMLTLRTGEPLSNIETKYRRSDGKELWLNINTNPIFYEHELKPRAVVVSFSDITRRKQEEKLIQARLYLIEFASTNTLDAVLQQSLDAVCDLLDSPIGFFHFVSSDEKMLTLKAWSTATLQHYCEVEDKRGMHYSVDEAGVWADCVRERRPIIHNSYPSLPRRRGLPEGHAPVIRQLVVPIMRQDRIVAILGVGNKLQDYIQKDIQVVYHFADLAWDIAQRKQAEEALQYQFQFEKMVAEISSTLVTTPADDLNLAFDHALQLIGEFFNIDRSYIFQFSGDGKTTGITHEWCAEGITPQLDHVEKYNLDSPPWWAQQIKNKNYVNWGHSSEGSVSPYLYIPDVELLPPEAAAEKAMLQRRNVQTIIAVPITINSDLYGILGFEWVKERKNWTTEQITLLRVVTDTITSALLKERVQEEQKNAHNRLLTVLNSIEALINVTDMQTYEVLFINHYGQKIWGDIVGKKCWQTLQKGQTGPCDFCTNHILTGEAGEPNGAYYWELNTKKGNWYECRDNALRWIDGRLVRLQIALDITEQKKPPGNWKKPERKRTQPIRPRASF